MSTHTSFNIHPFFTDSKHDLNFESNSSFEELFSLDIKNDNLLAAANEHLANELVKTTKRSRGEESADDNIHTKRICLSKNSHNLVTIDISCQFTEVNTMIEQYLNSINNKVFNSIINGWSVLVMQGVHFCDYEIILDNTNPIQLSLQITMIEGDDCLLSQIIADLKGVFGSVKKSAIGNEKLTQQSLSSFYSENINILEEDIPRISYGDNSYECLEALKSVYSIIADESCDKAMLTNLYQWDLHCILMKQLSTTHSTDWMTIYAIKILTVLACHSVNAVDLMAKNEEFSFNLFQIYSKTTSKTYPKIFKLIVDDCEMLFHLISNQSNFQEFPATVISSAAETSISRAISCRT